VHPAGPEVAVGADVTVAVGSLVPVGGAKVALGSAVAGVTWAEMVSEIAVASQSGVDCAAAGKLQPANINPAIANSIQAAALGVFIRANIPFLLRSI